MQRTAALFLVPMTFVTAWENSPPIVMIMLVFKGYLAMAFFLEKNFGQWGQEVGVVKIKDFFVF
ncbi:MAG: hypothetical protein KDC66_08850 [Phaeodactylibacter sp.]|nr:hypothetical protein [Phaeodactylibacter sp.]MCB9272417.1 hypothetical protein [Lewinellaceae bacterium]